jgi:hypothetical protein
MRPFATKEQYIERFRSKCSPLANGCICWLGKLHGRSPGKMYGRFTMNGSLFTVQRAAYILFKDDIPKGLVIDHLCRNTWCANPDHLEAVTNGENVRRGDNPVAINTHKVLCNRGHKFDKVSPQGIRVCCTCVRLANLRRIKQPKYVERRIHIRAEITRKVTEMATEGTPPIEISRALNLKGRTVRNMVQRLQRYGVINRTAVWM